MRIAIVNDTMLAAESLRRIVLSVPGYEISWVASNGMEAVNKASADRPDLILMDLIMPVMDGVEATRRIMNASPCPILVVTATVDGSAAKVFEAMGYGALDAINTPIMGNDTLAQKSRDALLKKIGMIAKLNTPSSEPVTVKPARQFSRVQIPPLVVIGSSTGGPKALSDLLSRLPSGLDAAVVIVQHVDEEFSASLVSWLDAQTVLQVRLARDGVRPLPGTIYVAGTNNHLVLTPDLTFSYTPEPKNIPYRPSVDVFFMSVAKHWPRTCVAVLLTGMGRDGAEGLAALRRAGWHTIAQDEKTSVVYGMPKAAKELNAVDEILPIEDIAPAILGFFGDRWGSKQKNTITILP